MLASIAPRLSPQKRGEERDLGRGWVYGAINIFGGVSCGREGVGLNAVAQSFCNILQSSLSLPSERYKCCSYGIDK